MTLICMKMKLHAELIFTWKVSHSDSFWNRGTRELGNGLLVQCSVTWSADSINSRRWNSHQNASEILPRVMSTVTKPWRHDIEVGRAWKRGCHFSHLFEVKYTLKSDTKNFSGTWMPAWNESHEQHHRQPKERYTYWWNWKWVFAQGPQTNCLLIVHNYILKQIIITFYEMYSKR